MATLKKNTPSLGNRIRTAIVDTLKASGIPAKVQTSPVPTTKLFRVAVFAPKFKQMKHSERQNLVWRIVENALPPKDQMRISMILTLTDEEASGK